MRRGESVVGGEGLVQWAAQFGIAAAIALYLVYFLANLIEKRLNNLNMKMDRIVELQTQIVEVQREIARVQDTILQLVAGQPARREVVESAG